MGEHNIYISFSCNYDIVTKMKNEIIGIIAVVAIIIALAAILRPTSGIVLEQPNTLDNIRSRGTINVCTINYPPWNIQDPATGEVSGVYVEAIELIAEKMGVTTHFEESAWGTIVPDLTTRRCDMNIAAVFPLIERAYGGVMFTHPLGVIGNNGVVKKGDNRFSSIEDLNREDITIAVIEGERGHIYAQQHLPKPQLRIISSADITLALIEVVAGSADVALADEWTIHQFLKANPDTNIEKMLNEPYSVNAFTWGVREGDQEWLNFLNNALGVLERNGELDALMEKYDAFVYKPE